MDSDSEAEDTISSVRIQLEDVKGQLQTYQVTRKKQKSFEKLIHIFFVLLTAAQRRSFEEGTGIQNCNKCRQQGAPSHEK